METTIHAKTPYITLGGPEHGAGGGGVVVVTVVVVVVVTVNVAVTVVVVVIVIVVVIGGLSLKLITAGERAGCLGFRFTPASTQRF